MVVYKPPLVEWVWGVTATPLETVTQIYGTEVYMSNDYLMNLLLFVLGVIGMDVAQRLQPKANEFIHLTYVMVAYVLITILFYMR